MSKADFWTCPNCGSTTFSEVASSKQQCTYCGTVLKLADVEQAEAALDLVTCYRCGFDNPQDARYCNNCGVPLMGAAALFERLKKSPATVSILVSVFGSLFIPLVGAVVGLVLAYRARHQAQAGRGSEKLARTAVIVGWSFLALGLAPFFLVLVSSGVQVGYTCCDNLINAVLNVLPGR